MSHNYEAYSSQYHHQHDRGQQRSGRGSGAGRRNKGGRGSGNGNKKHNQGTRGHRGGMSKLKNFIKDIKVEIGETKGFWTRLPYGMCKENTLVTSNSQASSPRASKKIAPNSNNKDQKVRNTRK